MATEEARKQEASSSTDQEKLKKPAKPQHEYFAIRKCDSLKAPAIFFAWEDCEFYVEEAENDGVVEFKGFDLILDATEWIFKGKNDGSIPKKTIAAIPAASQETKIRLPASIKKTFPNAATQINGTIKFIDALKNKQTSPSSRVAPTDTPKGKHDASTPAKVAPSNTTTTDKGGVAPKNPTQVRVPHVPHTQGPFPPAQFRWPFQQFHPMMWQAPFPHTFQPGHAPLPGYPSYPMPNQMPRMMGQPGMSGQGMSTTQVAVSRKRSAMDASLTNASRTSPATDRRQQKQQKMSASNAVGKPQPRLKNWQEQWDEQLELLKKYKATFGDTRVPMSQGKTPKGYDSLRIWLAMARPAVRIYQSNHKASTFLTKAKVEALMDVEFSKSIEEKKRDKSSLEDEWEKRFGEWSRYKKAQFTPEAFVQPRSVYDWELRTREQYNNLKEGDDTVLTALRMERLTEQGFEFTTTKPNVVPFEDRVKEWKEHRKTHGREPSIYKAKEASLGAWVKTMRRKYRQLKKGEGSKQGQEQVDALTDLGFTWNTGYTPTGITIPLQSWDESFADLLAYRVSRVYFQLRRLEIR
jgi:hypothetical protein